MKIETTERFINDLRQIAEFIAKDSKQKAQNFKNELNTQISKIALIPLSARKNLEVDNENVRDLIFKGYVIPFYVSKEKITLLAIYKHNIPEPFIQPNLEFPSSHLP